MTTRIDASEFERSVRYLASMAPLIGIDFRDECVSTLDLAALVLLRVSDKPHLLKGKLNGY